MKIIYLSLAAVFAALSLASCGLHREEGWAPEPEPEPVYYGYGHKKVTSPWATRF